MSLDGRMNSILIVAVFQTYVMDELKEPLELGAV